MPLILSIFGGMIATAVLFFVARSLGRSNFWSSALAAGAPSLAYFVYGSMNWPGLDVFTLNLIAYPTVAVILSQLFARRTKERMHWVPKLLVSFFVVLIGLLASFVYISTNGLSPELARKLLPKTAAGRPMHTGFAGVVEHGELAAKGISQHLKLHADMTQLGWQVEIEGLDALSARQAQTVSLLLRDTAGLPLDQASISISLKRPGQRTEQAVPLAAGGPGLYAARMQLNSDGHWLALINIDLAGKHIQLEHALAGE